MSLPMTPLAGVHSPLSGLLRQPEIWRERLLGFACFSASARTENALAGIPSIHVHTPPLLDPVESFCEGWLAPAPLWSGQCGTISFRHSDALLFGCLSVDESGFTIGDGARRSPLRQAAEFAYREIFGLLTGQGFPYLYRVWSYLPNINGESHGIERYRQFNSGRQDGFLAFHRALAGNVPAASTLGSADGPLSACFLAGRDEPLAIENPRQVSAYRYPQQYGPRPPVFSRATLARIGGRKVLFISGTASIVGHQSRHPDNAAAQTRETLVNIETVVQEANRHVSATRFGLGQMHFKIYVRRPADAAAIRAELHRFLGCPPQAVFLQADICRSDLLVEIEATIGHCVEPL